MASVERKITSSMRPLLLWLLTVSSYLFLADAFFLSPEFAAAKKISDHLSSSTRLTSLAKIERLEETSKLSNVDLSISTSGDPVALGSLGGVLVSEGVGVERGVGAFKVGQTVKVLSDVTNKGVNLRGEVGVVTDTWDDLRVVALSLMVVVPGESQRLLGANVEERTPCDKSLINSEERNDELL